MQSLFLLSPLFPTPSSSSLLPTTLPLLAPSFVSLLDSATRFPRFSFNSSRSVPSSSTENEVFEGKHLLFSITKSMAVENMSDADSDDFDRSRQGIETRPFIIELGSQRSSSSPPPPLLKSSLIPPRPVESTSKSHSLLQLLALPLATESSSRIEPLDEFRRVSSCRFVAASSNSATRFSSNAIRRSLACSR